MKIFYELTHTSCDSYIMRANADFDVYHEISGWDTACRPKPANANIVGSPAGKYDVAVIGTQKGLAIVPAGIPVIWKCLIDFGNWPKPVEILKHVCAWVAPCIETVRRWSMEGDPKAMVIEHGIDSDIFSKYEGDINSIITIGNLIPSRNEKGPDVLYSISKRIPIRIYGSGNDACAKNGVEVMGPTKNVQELSEIYKRNRAYFNPSNVVVCSVLEAMASGMPVVTMEPTNFKSLMKHRVNCFVSSTKDDAVYWLEYLSKNKNCAIDIGKAARDSVKYRFHPSYTSSQWEALFRKTACR